MEAGGIASGRNVYLRAISVVTLRPMHAAATLRGREDVLAVLGRCNGESCDSYLSVPPPYRSR